MARFGYLTDQEMQEQLGISAVAGLDVGTAPDNLLDVQTADMLYAPAVAPGTPLSLASFTVGTVPSATPAGRLIYISNESGGAVPAFSDGTNWLRVTDRAIIT